MSRPQFSLRTVLWLMLAVACFFAGMALQRKLDEPIYERPTRLGHVRGSGGASGIYAETIQLRDGTRWRRLVDSTSNYPAKARAQK